MLSRIARLILAPFTRVFRKFFDPRFFKLEAADAKTYAKLDAVAEVLWEDAQTAAVRDAAIRDGLTLTSTRIARIESELAAQQAYLQDTQMKLDYLMADVGLIRPIIESLLPEFRGEGTADDLNIGAATLLNYAESHRGFRSQAGLWFNPPDIVEYDAGRVSLSAITERSVEIPFVLSSVTSRKSPGATVLDVGCSESLVPLEFASLGYSVTGIDLREYPLQHPNLRTFATPVEDWETDTTFDVVVCLSSIEHFGLGTYGEDVADERLDHRAMQILLDWIEPDGVLVMTIPFGETEETPVQRMYDRNDLDALLDGWVIDTIEVAVPADDGWVVLDEIPEAAPTAEPPVTRQVALITAHPDV